MHKDSKTAIAGLIGSSAGLIGFGTASGDWALASAMFVTAAMTITCFRLANHFGDD